MTDPQLDLVTLTVSPEEARMIATALQTRAQHFANLFNNDWSPTGEYDLKGWSKTSKRYLNLRRKVEYQSGASDTP